ncbi:MAG: glycoside hydrolase family 30 protein [Solirubrobacteraceae bacterium]
MRIRSAAVCGMACAAVLASTCGIALGRSTSVEVVQTSADLAQHLTRLGDRQFVALPTPHGLAAIHVNDRARYQHVGGFGAAMTDSSAWLLQTQLPPVAGRFVMDELFGAGGIHLNFVRVPIGASDFTKDGRPYTYDDMPRGQSDPHLTHFSIAHDDAYILPALRQARLSNPAARMLASPWSPPAWMKSNNALNNVGHRGTLRPSAAGPWARYFVAFLRAYALAGIPISALTLQNEPSQATTYPGLELPESREESWLVRNLRPALRAAWLHPGIYGSDLGWGPFGSAYAKALGSGHVARALTGIASHCYFGSPEEITAFHGQDPRLDQIVDECSPGLSPLPTSEMVISATREWATTVAVWNLALDPSGGPVQVPNTGCRACSALVTVGAPAGGVTFGLNFFQLGQASAFVAPGAIRVAAGHFVSYRYVRSGVSPVSSGLDDVAFLNPDGSRVLVAYNNSSAAAAFAVQWHNRMFTYSLPARATVTFIWNRP